jgi:hypothetical protein
MNGYGEFIWPDGKKYYGFYINDKNNGFGIFHWESSNKFYFGEWENGKQHGFGLIYQNTQSKFGFWDKGIMTKTFRGKWEFQKELKGNIYEKILLSDPGEIIDLLLN